MPTFKFTPLVNSPFADVISAALGDGSSEIWSSDDVGKAVKLSADSTYALCSAGDEIEGFVVAVDAGPTVNSGFSFGSVQRNKRVEAEVASDQSGTMAVGDLVIAGAGAVMGTSQKAMVKSGTAASQSGTTPFAYTERTPNTHLWRCIAIVSGTGAVGDTVLIERI